VVLAVLRSEEMAMQILHFSDVHVQVDYRQIGYGNLDWRRLLAQLEMTGLGGRWTTSRLHA